MVDIVLVHGMGQEQKVADVLEAEWLPALAGGVRLAGYPEIADHIWRNRHDPGGIETRMAYYGYLFRPPGQMGAAPGDLRDEQAELAYEMVMLWLEHAASRASNLDQRTTAIAELAYLKGNIGVEPQGARRLSETSCAAPRSSGGSPPWGWRWQSGLWTIHSIKLLATSPMQKSERQHKIR